MFIHIIKNNESYNIGKVSVYKDGTAIRLNNRCYFRFFTSNSTDISKTKASSLIPISQDYYKKLPKSRFLAPNMIEELLNFSTGIILPVRNPLTFLFPE